MTLCDTQDTDTVKVDSCHTPVEIVYVSVYQVYVLQIKYWCNIFLLPIPIYNTVPEG
jgi:hypothetical protein